MDTTAVPASDSTMSRFTGLRMITYCYASRRPRWESEAVRVLILKQLILEGSKVKMTVVKQSKIQDPFHFH